jgi:oxygen-independent coproporphyrinogen-3 oxidase
MIPAELLRRLDVPAPRYTSYPTVPAWSERFGAADHAEALRRVGKEPISIYVHLPFCKELCSYCGCNVVITRDQSRVERYLDSLEREIALAASLLGPRRLVERLHLGGGTPTFLDERQLLRLWRALTGAFTIARDAEVALEIDPVVTRREQLALLAGFGFNRLSMGVQDFDPDVQRAVNRIQSVEETAAAIEYARLLGFGSINLDLIYGLPRQTIERFTATMEKVVALAPDRVAVFSFAYLPEQRPNQRRLPVADLPSADGKDALLSAATRALESAGFRTIGIDHFARSGDELAHAADAGTLWRDFQGYTPRRFDTTVAFGATGISDFGFAYVQNVRPLGEYGGAIAAGELPTAKGMWLDEDDRRRRAIITDLMCNGRADLVDAGAFERELAALAPLAGDGLVAIEGARLALSPLGRRFARNVAMVFDRYLHAGAQPFSRTV